MTELESLIKALDSAVWEISEAFADLADADVWTRPHPRLLSVGELAAHIAFGEADCFLPKGFESPLLGTAQATYYTKNVDEPFRLDLGAEAVYAELKRVHEACKAAVLEASPDMDSPSPNREGWTWRYVYHYQIFHVAYHTGQMYSVRHLMGHTTSDN